MIAGSLRKIPSSPTTISQTEGSEASDLTALIIISGEFPAPSPIAITVYLCIIGLYHLQSILNRKSDKEPMMIYYLHMCIEYDDEEAIEEFEELYSIIPELDENDEEEEEAQYDDFDDEQFDIDF